MQSRIAEQVAARAGPRAPARRTTRRSPPSPPTTSGPTISISAATSTSTGRETPPDSARPRRCIPGPPSWIPPSRSPSPGWPGPASGNSTSRTGPARGSPWRGVAADSALQLQPELPEAHLALGQIHYWGELDYERGAAGVPDRPRGRPRQRRHGLGPRAGRAPPGPVGPGARGPAAGGGPRPEVAGQGLDLFEVYLRRRRIRRGRTVHEPGPGARARLARLHLRGDADRRAATAISPRPPRTGGRGSPGGRRSIAAWAAAVRSRRGPVAGPDSSAQAAVNGLTLDRFGMDSAGYYLAKARTHRSGGDARAARVYFDSAATVLAGRTRARPDDPTLHAALAFAYAGLGRREDATREGRRRSSCGRRRRTPGSGWTWSGTWRWCTPRWVRPTRR